MRNQRVPPSFSFLSLSQRCRGRRDAPPERTSERESLFALSLCLSLESKPLTRRHPSYAKRPQSPALGGVVSCSRYLLFEGKGTISICRKIILANERLSLFPLPPTQLTSFFVLARSNPSVFRSREWFAASLARSIGARACAERVPQRVLPASAALSALPALRPPRSPSSSDLG